MKEKILISGFCPEITRGGHFDLEEILRISPRVLRSEEDQQIEVGRVKGIRQGYLFRNRYKLKTTGEDVPLEFYRRDKGELVLLGLPRNYGWGKEILEGQNQQ